MGLAHRCQTVGSPANISRICTLWKMRQRLRSAAGGVWCSREVLGKNLPNQQRGSPYCLAWQQLACKLLPMVGARHVLDPRLATVTDQNEGQTISVWAAELIHAGSFARFAGPRPYPRFLNCDGIPCDRIVAPDFRFWLNRHYVKCAVSIDCPHSDERV